MNREMRVRNIPLLIQELEGIKRINEPVTSGIPLPKGWFTLEGQARLLSSEGKELPCQISPLATWEDGSVKWILLDFQATASPNGAAQYRLELGNRIAKRTCAQKISVKETSSAILVNTGAVRFGVRKDCFGLLDSLSFKHETRDIWQEITLKGFDLVFTGGRNYVFAPYLASLDRTTYTVSVEEPGPLHAVIKCVGMHKSLDGKEPSRFVVRIHTYAGKPFLRVFYTYINEENSYVNSQNRLSVMKVEATLSLPTDMKEYAFGCEEGIRTGEVEEGKIVRLVQEGPTRWSTTDRAMHFPFTYRLQEDSGQSRTILGEGSKALGWVDLSSGQLGVTAAVRRFWQQHPKSLLVAPGVIELGIWYAPIIHGEMDQGEAKTHELLLNFHLGDWKEGQAGTVAARFRRPLMAVAYPQWYCDSKALGELSPQNVEKFPRYEQMVQTGFDSLINNREEMKEYGIRNLGDWHFIEEDPTGDIGWGNLEYDLAHCLLLQFVRTGDRKYFDRAEEAVFHQMDIDVRHYSTPPGFEGGHHRHCYDHTAGEEHLGHTFLEGLIEYYFFTGNRRPMEAAEEIGKYCVRAFRKATLMERQVRQIGWPLLCLTMLYRSTWDESYLRAAQIGVKQLLEWQDLERGMWPYPVNYCDHIPRHIGCKPFHVGPVMEGLKAYHEISGDEAVKNSLIKVADWLVNETWRENERGFYETACSRDIDTGCPGPISFMCLAGLAYAYEFTEKKRYLEVGLKVLESGLPDSREAYQGDGKDYAMMTRNSPRFIYLLEKLSLSEGSLSELF